MDQLGDILKKILKEAEDKANKPAQFIQEKWDIDIPENVKKHIRPLKINNKTLFMIVDSSTWLYEIKTKYGEKIKNNINKKSLEKKVEKVVFTVGTIDEEKD